MGDTKNRLKLIEQLTNAGYDVPVLIHPRAYVAPSAGIGKGSFVEPMAVVHTEVSVGVGCIISAGTIINHNAALTIKTDDPGSALFYQKRLGVGKSFFRLAKFRSMKMDTPCIECWEKLSKNIHK